MADPEEHLVRTNKVERLRRLPTFRMWETPCHLQSYLLKITKVR
jgi:hypothetical protein